MARRPDVLHVQKVSGISGSEKHLLGLLPDLRDHGWDARMLVLHEGEPGAAEFAGLLLERGVPVEGVRMSRDLDPAAAARFARALLRLRPRILHTHLVHADFYGQTLGALLRVPLRISTKHGFDDFRHVRAFALADRTIARFAHHHIAISDGLARYLSAVEGFDTSAFEVIRYGIHPGAEPPPYPDGPPRLLCVGRLIPVKGHSVLLHAFAEAHRQVPGLTLDLAGAGKAEPELRALVDELDLDGAVRFLGSLSPIEPTIEQAAIVVVPSLGEGFGMVALEAMERGRAVIASHVGGLGEIVAHGETGLLVPPGETGALAEAIVELASDLDRVRRMGAAGRERVVSHFLADRSARETADLYRTSLNGSARPSAGQESS